MQIVELGGLQLLLPLTHSSDAEVQRLAAHALANLSVHGTNRREWGHCTTALHADGTNPTPIGFCCMFYLVRVKVWVWVWVCCAVCGVWTSPVIST